MPPPTKPSNTEEARPVTRGSSDEDDGAASEPEGFDSCDEEEYANKRDPFEDGEDSQLLPPASPTLSWKSATDPDPGPPASRFQPARRPGPQLSAAATPVELFKMFFPEDAVQTLCTNTNKQAAKQKAIGRKYKWTDLDVFLFYKYMGLLLYIGTVKLDSVTEYWRQNHIFSLPFPCQVMSRDTYSTISWNLHLSDPDEDVHNDRKEGAADHDTLFRVKPLMDTIRSACKALYHPHRDLAVGERAVASRAKRGIKLFVLADCRNGYTVDFSIYTGKSSIPSGHGLSYDVVMSLVRPGCLGTGYHVYMDHFHSSPKLFMALHARGFAACGPYREHRRGCPRTDTNALTRKSARGSMRWIRDGPIVYVKWMDVEEVSVCSTIHSAYSGGTVRRRVKQPGGSWSRAPVACPTPVAEYNERVGGVAPSDRLIQYHSAQHKTMRWYRKLFYHLLDIATTNSFVLHRELCLAQGATAMTHSGFVEHLTAELCGKPFRSAAARPAAGHLPVLVAAAAAACPKLQATTGRRMCEHCKTKGRRKDTPWKCSECDVSLCLQLDRNCFKAWHDMP